MANGIKDEAGIIVVEDTKKNETADLSLMSQLSERTILQVSLYNGGTFILKK